MAQNLRTGRHFPPAQEGNALFLADDLEQLLSLVAPQLLLGEEEHTDTVFPLPAQRDADPAGRFGEKFMTDLQQNADTVTGLALCVLTGAVLQMLYDLQCVIQSLVAFPAFDIHHRANAAIIVLKPGIIQPGGVFALRKIFHSFVSSPHEWAKQ